MEKNMKDKEKKYKMMDDIVECLDENMDLPPFELMGDGIRVNEMGSEVGKKYYIFELQIEKEEVE